MKLFSLLQEAALGAALLFSLTASAQSVDPAQDPHIAPPVRTFLKALNAGGGKPLEQLTPKRPGPCSPAPKRR